MEVIIGSNDYDAFFRRTKTDRAAYRALGLFTFVVIPQSDFGEVRKGFLEGRGEGVQGTRGA